MRYDARCVAPKRASLILTTILTVAQLFFNGYAPLSKGKGERAERSDKSIAEAKT